MTPMDTWCLPEVKRRLLVGERVTQADMLAITGGRAWRLAAAVYYLRKRGWDIRTTENASGCAVYHLPPNEIARLRSEGVAA
ncbi:MAG: hypothetical protein D6720_07170 [Gammaproteobacteria bacterium]|nr:MAG: hypothetical protein D6720_07170 [Gammaproteobacteria bacterium]